MEKQHLRVMVASEYPQARDLLREIAEGDEGAIFVGQAPDSTRALTLARNLRPDVAIIDSNLPYSVGLDTVRLSRMGGLDTAQTIFEMTPGIRVILVTNLDTPVLTEHSLSMDAMSFFYRERAGGHAALKFEELYEDMRLSESPVFASVEVKPWPVTEQKSDEATRGALHFGTVSLGSGLFLIGTIWLAPYGALLVLAGIGALAFGTVRKISSRLWPK